MSENTKQIPIKFMEYETKITEIKKILSSGNRREYLYERDNFDNDSILVSIENQWKSRNLLVTNIMEKYDVYNGARIPFVRYIGLSFGKKDSDVLRILLRCLKISGMLTHRLFLEYFSTATDIGDPKIIELFLDYAPEYDIFDIYNNIFDLPHEKRDIVLELLVKNSYYGPIIVDQTIQNFKIIAKSLPTLCRNRIVSVDILGQVSIEEYKKSVQILEKFKKIPHEIPDMTEQILYQPGSMEAKKLKYNTTFLQKFGLSRIADKTETEKKEYYDVISVL